MNRYHITLGAHTSAGGKVITANSCCSINDVAVALEGDAIFCPACKSLGKIKIFGPRIPESWNGKQVALQDDLCVCKCASPPRLIPNQKLKYQSIGGAAPSGEAAMRAAALAREENQAAALGKQQEQVRLRFLDDVTQQPLGSRRYRLDLPAKTIEGVTDDGGYTEPIDAADRARLVAWHLFDRQECSMSTDVFTKHQQDQTPLGRNTMPVAECDVHDAKVGGKSCKAIDVPILSCASIWLRVQREAEAWVAPGGKLIADPIARNRRINQAYAQLWQADRRFQWAALAAFASKRVGCGLLHAADNVRKSQEEIAANAKRPDISGSADIAAMNTIPAVIGGSSAYMYQQLALGNTTLFLDIYPLHRFYMLRGLKHLQTCLKERASIAKDVIWPADKTKLAFGKPFKAIPDAFEMIEKGMVSKSVELFAYHEQINVLQAVIYNDIMMRRALDANLSSWVSNFPTGAAAEISLTLSAECRTKSNSHTVIFSKNRTARLYDETQRMKFVYAAAARFDALLHDSGKTAVEHSIAEIAINGGKQ